MSEIDQYGNAHNPTKLGACHKNCTIQERYATGLLSLRLLKFFFQQLYCFHSCKGYEKGRNIKLRNYTGGYFEIF